jgi:hypothetical protein
VTDAELLAILRRLRAVREGTVFESHHVRVILAEAEKVEERLGNRHERIWKLRRDAEKAFVAGWPDICPWKE